jgi:hypothetical protein
MKEQAVETYNAPVALKLLAKVISYVFHPLFIPTYIFLFLASTYTYEFQFQTRPFLIQFVTVFWMSAFFPAFAVFLLWKLKFSDSIYLRTQKERIGPYIITMVFYWWLWYLGKNFTDQSFALRIFFLGSFLTTPVALIINNFFKISMHAIAVGCAAAFITIIAFNSSVHLGQPIAIAWIIAGLVCTARFLVSDHTGKEIYTGLILGIICQLIAAWVTY